MDREFIEDPIKRTLVWSVPNDQLESECIGFWDLAIARGGRDSIMNVGHWTLTFELFALSTVKPVPSEEQPPIPKRKPVSSTLKYAFFGEGK